MSNVEDMIVPMFNKLREDIGEVRAETKDMRAEMNQRFSKIDSKQKIFHEAQVADTFMSKLITGDFEIRLEALEAEVKALKAGH